MRIFINNLPTGFQQQGMSLFCIFLDKFCHFSHKNFKIHNPVDTKRINEQARRNIERFPDRFRFQLTNEETSQLVAFCDRFKALKHSTVNPFAYTEQGVAMLATVLKSETAVKVSIVIMDAFVEMHRLMESTAGLSQRDLGKKLFAFSRMDVPVEWLKP